MVVSFKGTSTEKSYTAGSKYTTGDGRTLQANSDGSFTNVKTGQVSKGSSDYVREAEQTSKTASDSASKSRDGAYANGYLQKQGGGGGGGYGTGAGTGYVAGNSGLKVTGPGAAQQVGGGMFEPYDPDQTIKTTKLFWGGLALNLNRGISDGGDFEDRWGEWGGAIAGLAVMGADISRMAQLELQRQAAGWVKTNPANYPQGNPDRLWNQTDASYLEQQTRRKAAEMAQERNASNGLAGWMKENGWVGDGFQPIDLLNGNFWQ